MNWDLFTGFCAACAILGLMPGPAVGTITATAFAHGTRAAMSTVFGGMIAVAVQMSLLVAFTASLFEFLHHWMPVIRWVGVAYLMWLGVETWRNAGKEAGPDDAKHPAAAMSQRGFVLRGLLVNATNPKALGFYAAFFPQFIDGSLPLVPQVTMLALGYFTVLFAIDSGWALAGGRINALFKTARARRWRDRASGGLLMGAAAGLASIRTG